MIFSSKNPSENLYDRFHNFAPCGPPYNQTERSAARGEFKLEALIYILVHLHYRSSGLSILQTALAIFHLLQIACFDFFNCKLPSVKAWQTALAAAFVICFIWCRQHTNISVYHNSLRRSYLPQIGNISLDSTHHVTVKYLRQHIFFNQAYAYHFLDLYRSGQETVGLFVIFYRLQQIA